MESQPELFGRFRLLEVIGAGGMAEVFLAKMEGPQGFERRLAIKRILPNYSRNDAFVQMFIDEARLVGHFNHSNIVQIYEFGKIGDSYFISMEYVDGTNVAELLSWYKSTGQMIPLEVILEVAIQICHGIDYAHRETDEEGRPLGIVHRDLTPQNLLLSRKGVVKITDFGIAKASMNTHMTQAGMIKGKVPYMSPEQATGLPLTHVSDIFTLGIVLYELCTLRRLFEGENDFFILRKVQEAKVPSICMQNPAIPQELERIILKALARDRDQRYQWASEMEADLTRLKFSFGSLFQKFSLSEFVTRFLAARQAPAAQATPMPKGDDKPTEVRASLSALAAELSDLDDPLSMATMRLEPEAAQSTLVLPPEPSARGTERLPEPPRALATPESEISGGFVGPASSELETEPPPPTPVSGHVSSPSQEVDANFDEVSVKETVKVPLLRPGTQPLPPAPTAALNPTPPPTPAPTPAPTPMPVRPRGNRMQWALAALFAVAVVVVAWLMLFPRKGSIVVDVSPRDAQIYLDGEKVADGGPYLRQGLKAGQSVTILVKKDGFEEQSRAVIIEGGVRKRLPLTLVALSQGSLHLESIPPGAKVLLRGVDSGQVTPCDLELAPGMPYEVSLQLAGYVSAKETVTVKKGERQALKLELVKEGATPGASGAPGTDNKAGTAAPAGAAPGSAATPAAKPGPAARK